LADFYDVPTYQPWLDKIDNVGIDYVGPERESTTVAPQALLIAGWLASRLGWSPLTNERPPTKNDETLIFKFKSQGVVEREITLEMNRVERGGGIQGKLVRVELRTNADKPGSFMVARSTDNLHLLAEAKLGQRVHRGRVLPVRNRSAAQLLSREMEILCNDNIYQQALAVATTLINLLRSSQPDQS
jgi:glucose-6-phosphate dehydrogenase assembly protein OpcA